MAAAHRITHPAPRCLVDARKVEHQRSRAIRHQGAVGVIGIGGAAIRAENENGVRAQFRLCLNSLRKIECLEL